jgi:putative ABC transport system permease protein
MSSLYLALAYLRHHWIKSLVVVLASGLILAVPLVTQSLLARSQALMTQRAETTPLLLGRQGSALDLAIKALYFQGQAPQPASMATVDMLWDTGYADIIPLHIRFRAGGAPVVGTSIDYLDFRGFRFQSGRAFSVIGEVVLGSEVARRLGLQPGQSLVSQPENLFDLTASYPLQLDVVGVLEPSGTPDDGAIFTDIKTSWIIQGIGHGHDDVIAAGVTPDGVIVANAAQRQFARITDDNRSSFHFHGDPEGYPVTAIIALPYDHKSKTILRGLFQSPDSAIQAIQPAPLIAQLMDSLFRFKALLDAVVAVVALAALFALGLAVFLSLQLRQAEMRTNYQLGAGRWFSLRLVSFELLILLAAGAGLAILAWLAADALVGELVVLLIAPTL